MVKKRYKVISGILVAAIVVPSMGDCNLSVQAQGASEEKAYVIVAENDAIYHEVSEEVGDSITVETPVLLENNVMVAELTDEEAAALGDDREVVVEEDTMVFASGTEVYEPETQELTIEEARKRKEEIKQRKQDRIAELEESENNKTEADPEYEWNLQAIHAQESVEAEDQSQQRVKVAVLDSGVDYVTGINLTGYVNMVDEEQEITPIFQDLTGHGTGVASIISGNGENGIYGVNPNVELYSVKVLDEKNTAPISRIIRGIYWCVENDIDIINMSFGTQTYSRALEEAVEDAYEAGLLMVAAAGNGSDEVEYPAAFEEVMAVASVNPEAEISEFSNTGEELDVAAPGEKVRVAGFFNGSIVTHGTSIAAPHVTGVASLLWEKDLTKSNEFIRQLINYSAKELSGTDECGLLDAGYALDVYESFAQEFEEIQTISEEDGPKNTKSPEIFEYVNEDEAYVEGRWRGSDHTAAVDKGAAGFSAEAIQIIKKGAVYPDNSASGLESGQKHSEWHGKWENYVDEKGEIDYEINYVAVYEMVTEVALEGGDIKSYMTVDWFNGMNQNTYNKLKAGINSLKNQYSSVLSSDTKENRKYFLYGCGIHIMADTFAHSTARANKDLIGHSANNGSRPDDVTYYPRRYQTAAKLTEYAMASLKNGDFTDGEEVQKALRDVYTSAANFKVINLKKYMNANGYSGAVINDANIDENEVNK